MLSIRERLLGMLRGYSITPPAIWLRQRGGWVELRQNDIATIKLERVGQVIVWFYDGRRVVVSLFDLSNSGHAAVCRAFQDALRHNEMTRGLWDGAMVSSGD
jgi:hypothetical protein